jgi:hypothetical protein
MGTKSQELGINSVLIGNLKSPTPHSAIVAIHAFNLALRTALDKLILNKYLKKHPVKIILRLKGDLIKGE